MWYTAQKKIKIQADPTSEECKWEDSGMTSLKILKEQYCKPRVLLQAKISFKHEGKISNTHKNLEKTNHQHSFTRRKAKGSPSGKRKVTSVGNVNLYKGMNTIINNDVRGL